MRRGSGDLQERIVQLYFVRGWSVRSICDRYGLSKAMAHKLLGEWRVRAVESGYIQEIEPGTLASLSEQTRSEQTRSEQTRSEQTSSPKTGLEQTIRQDANFDANAPGVARYAAVPMAASPAAGGLPKFVYESAVPVSIPRVEHPAALSARSGA
jgi:transposase-like protein